ncbi:MAG: efflux RND transporter permease subunit [Hyphomicrobiales bacterium]
MTLAGAIALTQIPIAQFPDIVPPQISVTANYPGAGSQVVEATVAQPIESRVVGVDNMLYMKSTSGNDGSYSLTVTFAVGTDPDLNSVKVQNRVGLAEAQLPAEVKATGVSVTKKSSAILLVVNLISPDSRFDQLFLSNYATINIIDSLKRIKGIGDVQNFTAADYSMRLWLDSAKLTNFGMTPNDVITAVKGQNIQAAVGRIGSRPSLPDQQFQLNIQTQGRLTTVEEFGAVVVRANPDGSFVRVRDVARIELGARSQEQIGRLDGKPAVVMGLYQTPGGNAIQSADAVRKALEDLKKSFPEGLDYRITYDTTAFVKHSMEEVIHTLLEAFLLVVIVVFLFLGSFRATLIPLIAVPVALIGTFAVMLAVGFSANTVSLLALVLGIGIVVDDAIVVVEAVEAHLEKDHSIDAAEAARRAMAEITAPIIAITLVLLSVFVPVAFIPGISGELFRQFAVAVSVSMVISAINALTLSPALCAVFLSTSHGPKRGILGYVMRGIDHTRDGYAFLVRKTVRFAVFGILVLVVVMAGAGWLFKVTPSGFLPSEDQGAIFGEIQLPEGASVVRTDAVSKRVEDLIAKTPGVASVTSVVGFSMLDGMAKSNGGLLIITLKSFEERKGAESSINGLIRQLMGQFQRIQEEILCAYNMPPIIGLGTGSGLESLSALAARPESELPSLLASVSPVVVPVGLIASGSFLSLFRSQVSPEVAQLITFLGNKNIALFIAGIIALALLAHQKRIGLRDVSKVLGPPLETAGVIILIVSAGGAYGAMIKNSGVGDAIRTFAGGNTTHYVLLAWIISAAIRVVQGSATVATITAVGIMQSVAGSEGYGVHPIYIMVAIGFGSKFLNWMNDSGFWVVNRFSGLTQGELLRSWSILISVVSLLGLAEVLLVARLFPHFLF